MRENLEAAETKQNAQLATEKTLDKTLADSFPTSDPPSTIPNPGDSDAPQKRRRGCSPRRNDSGQLGSSFHRFGRSGCHRGEPRGSGVNRAAARARQIFFVAGSREIRWKCGRLNEWSYAAFFLGTFAPFSRASESPIAIACLRLFTLPPLPPLPERSVPFFLRCIALLTLLPAALPYLRPDDFFFVAISSPGYFRVWGYPRGCLKLELGGCSPSGSSA